MAEQLQSIFNLLAVVLRGSTLIGEALAIGGIAFALIAQPDPIKYADIWKRTSRVILWSAIVLGISQIIFVSFDVFMLMRTAEIPLSDALGADFVNAGAVFVGACFLIVLLLTLRGEKARVWLAAPALALVVASMMTSHAVARMEYRAPLGIATAVHQLGMSVWIGGLPYLWIAIKRTGDATEVRRTAINFSRTAMVSVAGVAISGAVLSVAYVGSWNAMYGTSHGAMVMTKVVLFLCLLVIGGLNYRLVHNTNGSQPRATITLRRLIEAEVGIGLTVILAAASLTSQPPAVDVQADRASAAEISERMVPEWPSMKTPTVRELGAESHWAETLKTRDKVRFVPDIPADQLQEKQRADGVEWSEYNHHWSGLIVLAIGVFAFAARSKNARWATHWPLLFLALATFLLLRSDPEVWPLGPFGFWHSFTDPEVVQHRIAVLLVVAFAIFEWRIQTGRSRSNTAALVFPVVCASGGALLLTHSHALYNVKEQLLVELTHLPLAVLACVAGWSRWLEIRLPSEQRVRKTLAWVWPVCFVIIGLLLINYREA